MSSLIGGDKFSDNEKIKVARRVLTMLSPKYGLVFDTLSNRRQRKASELIIERNVLLMRLIEDVKRKGYGLSHQEEEVWDNTVKKLRKFNILFMDYRSTRIMLTSRTAYYLDELYGVLNVFLDEFNYFKQKKKKFFDKYFFPQGYEVEKGVYVDCHGDTFGIGHFTDHKEDFFHDLEEIEGRTKCGGKTIVRLRKTALEAWLNLTQFIRNAYGIQIYATAGHRSFNEQDQLKRRYGVNAASPGRSDAHLGTTVYVFEGNTKQVYGKLMSHSAHKIRSDILPPAVKYGFVPTVRSQSWRFRFVGPKAAEVFWSDKGKIILKSHTKMLKDSAIY